MEVELHMFQIAALNVRELFHTPFLYRKERQC